MFLSVKICFTPVKADHGSYRIFTTTTWAGEIFIGKWYLFVNSYLCKSTRTPRILRELFSWSMTMEENAEKMDSCLFVGTLTFCQALEKLWYHFFLCFAPLFCRRNFFNIFLSVFINTISLQDVGDQDSTDSF